MKIGTQIALKKLVVLVFATELTIESGVTFAQATAAETQNPYSPSYGHSYRQGAFPTLDTHAKMQEWSKEHGIARTAKMIRLQKSAGITGAGPLSYGGGVSGVGVIEGIPKVYLVVWGTQWGSQGTNASGYLTFSNDAVGAVPYEQSFLSGLGTGGEQWSGVMTQYCDGSSVAAGATSCSTSASPVGYPMNGALAGVWYDNSGLAPQSATMAQLAAEANAAAAHFGNTTQALNRNVQYIVMSPSGTQPDGFNAGGGFCAWHSYTSSSYGNVAYTNLPYLYDMGANCGAGSVNGNTGQGNLDGYSIVEGHEYAETLTDVLPTSGWANTINGTRSDGENGDECAWLSLQNVSMGTGSFAMQPTWSNGDNQCEITRSIASYAAYYTVTEQLYLAYLGRPADPSGMAYWAAALQAASAPTTLSGLANAYSSSTAVRNVVNGIANSSESQAYYTESNATTFVTQIYNNLFSRAPDSGGLNFWVNAISQGTPDAEIPLAIMSDAQTTDATTAANKTAISYNFTGALTPHQTLSYSGSSAMATARQMLQNVTSTTNVSAFQSTILSTIATIVANNPQ